ncbi:hypothetical protein Q0590_35740 [Rhodocytophaga aerolata]|uniref:Uncharacterized protein n=1 Tax=Rhodocytophaga aerolata TaxID=455078 RepID=A0ABT8RHU9_9BACT|nr:hypothetical protein [Rhodocytophaga aerolata]MDO1451681.1 hypothetical protein [Rhodocytophaga aerolata]
MKAIFWEYIQIHLDKGLIRDLRNAKIKQLLQSQDLSDIKVEELVAFEQELDKLKINFTFPFFEKVYFPTLEKGYKAGELAAIKLMLKHISIIYQIERKRETSSYSEFALIDKGLEICPTDQELLLTKERCLESYLDFTIHEVPYGVLYGMDGASPDECLKLLDTLEEYKELCHTLGVDRDDLIAECYFHYQHYYIYLQDQQKYTSYEQYLKKYYP